MSMKLERRTRRKRPTGFAYAKQWTRIAPILQPHREQKKIRNAPDANQLLSLQQNRSEPKRIKANRCEPDADRMRTDADRMRTDADQKRSNANFLRRKANQSGYHASARTIRI